MYAAGQSRANGGGGEGGRDALLRRRRQPGPSSSSPSSLGSAAAAAASAAAASSSSSDRGEEAGGGKRLWRRRKQGKREAVARAVRDGLPAAAASCWRGVTLVQESGDRTGRTRWRDSGAEGSARAGHSPNSGEGGSGATPAAWCCVCPGDGDCCALEPNPSANGKEDPGLRSLLERNDFFAADCNPHADGLPSSW